MKPNTVALTIAGSDSGGGAGIQADLKTFSALGVYGASVITAITAQNLSGVTGIQGIDPDIVKKQLTAVLSEFPVKAVKTGMLYSKEIIEAIVDVFQQYRSIPLVIDPVFAATSGSKLIQDSAIDALSQKLFPMASLITPNMPEAEFLTGDRITSVDELKIAARKMFERFHVPILAKGGHLGDVAHDILFDDHGMEIYSRDFIKGVNNHGSGCTFASAIAAELAKGATLRNAIQTAKDYLYNALKHSHPLIANASVINHFWKWE
jgi:hydroxymethylpyrimidine/phosphomethylpyrimidine kinase